MQYIPVGAEIEGIGADDIEELSEGEDKYYKLGAEDDDFKDYKALGLKLDHSNRSGSRVKALALHLLGLTSLKFSTAGREGRLIQSTARSLCSWQKQRCCG